MGQGKAEGGAEGCAALAETIEIAGSSNTMLGDVCFLGLHFFHGELRAPMRS